MIGCETHERGITMDLDQVLEEMQANETQTKVASAPNAIPAGRSDALLHALEKTAYAPVQPVGAAGDVVDDLVKMASELAGTEKEAEVAHASLLGQAFADAAISKFASYEAQATRELAYVEQQKVAAAPHYDDSDYATDAELEKIAGLGYADAAALVQAEMGEGTVTDDELEKVAELGYADAASLVNSEMGEGTVTESELEKVAELGYADAANLVQAEMEKEAGYGDEAAEIDYFVKTASDDEVIKVASEAGYSDTVEKIAEDYQEGHDEALQEVHDVAMGEFLKGAAETESIINALSSQQ